MGLLYCLPEGVTVPYQHTNALDYYQIHWLLVSITVSGTDCTVRYLYVCL
jgi:hypothetical protein